MATTLVNLFGYLAYYPHYQMEIREELKGITRPLDFEVLLKLPVLRSIIKETLRLWPPIPTGSSRLVPPAGLNIAGVYIPANTVIFAPRYTIARCK
jgi:cytochrome P450